MNKEILIIKLGAIGDVLRTTSILNGLKEKFQNSNISWLTKKRALDILKNNRSIDNIYLIENNIDKILQQDFDLIISLDDEDIACSIATKVKTKKLIGAYLKDKKKTYTEDSSPWFDMSLISRFGKERADILKKQNKKTYQQLMLEILDIKTKKFDLILNISKKEISFAQEFAKINNLNKSDLVIGLNTGASKRWPLKKLPKKTTAELADKLVKELNAKIILFGGPEERERNNIILEKAKEHIIDAGCNNSLLEFAALINLCDILITSDSLALHIGTALKKKIVVFFGPTSAAEIELYGRGVKLIADEHILATYIKKELDPNPMDKLSVDNIFNSVKCLLESNQ